MSNEDADNLSNTLLNSKGYGEFDPDDLDHASTKCVLKAARMAKR